MKLNICCGRQVLDGWINIDIARSPKAPRAPEMLADCRKVPLADGCAEQVMVIHGFEHLYRWECDEAMTEWRRLLRAGGRLILELPDLVKCAKNLLNGYRPEGRNPDQYSMWGIYGDPRDLDPFMVHRWGWTPQTLEAFLSTFNFTAIQHLEPQWHPAGRKVRDMRLEAVKP